MRQDTPSTSPRKISGCPANPTSRSRSAHSGNLIQCASSDRRFDADRAASPCDMRNLQRRRQIDTVEAAVDERPVGRRVERIAGAGAEMECLARPAAGPAHTGHESSSSRSHTRASATSGWPATADDDRGQHGIERSLFRQRQQDRRQQRQFHVAPARLPGSTARSRDSGMFMIWNGADASANALVFHGTRWHRSCPLRWTPIMATHEGDHMPESLPSIPPSLPVPPSELLDIVQSKLGMTPNLMRTLANAPAALKGYLDLNTALAGGVLDGKFREQIALAVAQANACDYCLSAHTTLGAMAGLTPNEVTASRGAARPSAARRRPQARSIHRRQPGPGAGRLDPEGARRRIERCGDDRDRRQRRTEHPDQLHQPRGADGGGLPAGGGRTRRYGLKTASGGRSRPAPARSRRGDWYVRTSSHHRSRSRPRYSRCRRPKTRGTAAILNGSRWPTPKTRNGATGRSS